MVEWLAVWGAKTTNLVIKRLAKQLHLAVNMDCTIKK